MSSISSAFKSTKDSLWRSANKYFGGRSPMGGAMIEGGKATGFSKAFPTFKNDPVYKAFPGQGAGKPQAFRDAFEQFVVIGGGSVAGFKQSILGGARSPRPQAGARRTTRQAPAAAAAKPKKVAGAPRSPSPFTQYTNEKYAAFKQQRDGQPGPAIWEAFLRQYQGDAAWKRSHPKATKEVMNPRGPRIGANGQKLRSPLQMATDQYYGTKGSKYRAETNFTGTSGDLWKKFKSEKYPQVKSQFPSSAQSVRNPNAKPTTYQQWLHANSPSFPLERGLKKSNPAQYKQQRSARANAWRQSPEYMSRAKAPLNDYAAGIKQQYSAPGGFRDQYLINNPTAKASEAWAAFKNGAQNI